MPAEVGGSDLGGSQGKIYPCLGLEEHPMPADSSQVLASFAKLSITSATLNSATDRLNRAVASLDDSLRKLNLGIPCWVQFSLDEHGPLWFTEDLGYAKINGKWCIGLKKTDGDINSDNTDEITDETTWPFAEAPREMRIRAIVYLQKLIDRLDEEAANATKMLEAKSAEAEQLAKVFDQAAATAYLRKATGATKNGGKK
jgi:hypothetical protein